MTRRSAVYAGSVMHRRFSPRQHHFRYRAFWFLLDLDELPELARSTRLFSYNRLNLFSLHDRDHGDGSAASIRAQIAHAAARERGRCAGCTDRAVLHAPHARLCVQSAQHLLLPPSEQLLGGHCLSGSQHIRRTPQLCDSRRRERPGRPAAMSKGVLCLAVHGPEPSLRFPHHPTRRSHIRGNPGQ